MPKSSRLLVVVMLLVFCLAPATASASDPVHWGYEGEIGPQYWGTLSPDYAACGAGKEQSPVDIPTGAVLNPADLKFNYQPSSLNIANNGHSIQVNYDAGSSLEAGGVSWPLTQFHLHSLSEHTLAGAQTPVELHLVHKDAKGRIAVVGVMLVEGAQNDAYQPVLANMPAQEGEPEVVAGATVDAASLLPTDRSYYRYNGSLTDPPCTESVSWFVMAKPVELSAAQIAAFKELYDGNFRPVQPVNDRTFLLTSDLPPAVLPGTGGGSTPLILEGMGLCVLLIGLELSRRRRTVR